MALKLTSLAAVLKGHKTDAVFQLQLLPSILLSSNQVIGPFPLESDQDVLSSTLNIAGLFFSVVSFPTSSSSSSWVWFVGGFFVVFGLGFFSSFYFTPLK